MTLFPVDDVIARGRKTVVRRKRMSDAADEYSWRTDAELAKYDASRPVRAPFADYQRNWSFDMRFTDTAWRSFAVEDERGRHIGNIMYYNQDASRGEAEVGISIGKRECWDQGYGTDAVHALVEYLFRTTEMRRLYLHTLDWNERAHKAFEKAGFSDCGTSWRDGHTFVVMEVWRNWVVEAPDARAEELPAG
ncbi:MAG: GNAT family N-acetyltransferase [Dehalococcoidia bacterium]